MYVNIESKRRKSTDTGLVARYLSIYLHCYWYQGNLKEQKKHDDYGIVQHYFQLQHSFREKTICGSVLRGFKFDILSELCVMGVLNPAKA